MNRVEAKAPWVSDWGYSRATRIGPLIEVGGTTAGRPDGSIAGVGDLYVQTAFAFQVALDAIRELGGRREDVIRTRVFVRHIEDWRDAGRAHVEIFGDLLPTSTCVGGLEFLHPDLLVEIEMTAYVQDS